MIARSIHPIPAPPVDDAVAPISEPVEFSAPRLRRVTNDPATEYESRAGAVEPLPNSVAALILCKKGWRKVERHQIEITLDGEDLVFASLDSIVIAEKNGTGEQVLWAINRRAPYLLHLLTNDGRYIESVPLKKDAEWFSRNETSQAAYADAQAQIQRDAQRLRDLHAKDTEMAARTAQENAQTTHRLIQTFPVATPERSERPDTANEQGSGRALFPKADEIGEAMRVGEAQRERHVTTVRAEESRTASALRMGQALREQLFAVPAGDISPEPSTQPIEEQC